MDVVGHGGQVGGAVDGTVEGSLLTMSFLSPGGRAAALCLVGLLATPIGNAVALTSSLFGPTMGVTELFASEPRSGTLRLPDVKPPC